MAAWLEKKGMPILLEHQVTRVVKEGNRVVGVEAMHDKRLVRIRARQGVVFGSGGFAHNVELVKRYQPSLYGSCAPLGSTGDLIAIAEEAGARMGLLSYAFRTQVALEEALENRALALCAFQITGDSMVMVNRHGKRVYNEKLNYQDRTPAHLVWDGVASIESPLLRVHPGKPEESYMMHKLDGSHLEAGGQGERMPFGQPQLDEVVRDKVRAWIRAGAKKN